MPAASILLPVGFSQPPGFGRAAMAFHFEPQLCRGLRGGLGGVFRDPPDVQRRFDRAGVVPPTGWTGPAVVAAGMTRCIASNQIPAIRT
jgi:hypothetical protein